MLASGCCCHKAGPSCSRQPAGRPLLPPGVLYRLAACMQCGCYVKDLCPAPCSECGACSPCAGISWRLEPAQGVKPLSSFQPRAEDACKLAKSSNQPYGLQRCPCRLLKVGSTAPCCRLGTSSAALTICTRAVMLQPLHSLVVRGQVLVLMRQVWPVGCSGRGTAGLHTPRLPSTLHGVRHVC